MTSLALALLIGSVLPACGGGSVASVEGESTGQGLILMEFRQAGQDNVPINQVLEFAFSEPVDPSTLTTGSIQVREGPAFGLSAPGRIRVSGSEVMFEPRLPTTCSKADAAFKPGRTYRITLLGAPEATAIRNTHGQPLEATRTFEFRTLYEGDPDHLADQRPGVAPSVLATTPSDGTAAVTVGSTNEVVVRFSENIDPCTVIEGQTIRATVHELGDLDTFLEAPNGNRSGFDPVEDAVPSDPTTWGGNASVLSTPARLDAVMALEQDFESTVLRIRPRVGGFPENSLIVVECTSNILDFGGLPLPREIISFTTENLARRESDRVVEFDADTPIDATTTTADVNTARSPSRAQAWLNFGGDGDNGGGLQILPSWPILDQGDASHVDCSYQPNDGTVDAFDPTTNVVLNTGSTPLPDTCANESDGSRAVIWEFESFRIRSGVTVTLLGVNPAIILVRGGAVIETGGRLLLRGSSGQDSVAWVGGTTSAARLGGTGTAGGGRGGSSLSASQAMGGAPKSQDGFAGFGSPDHDPLMGPGGPGEGGFGTGQGGSSSFPAGCLTTGGAQGGGGGGHATNGDHADDQEPAGSTWDVKDVGRGGANLPDERMLAPTAGSGGGGGGSESSTPGSDESSGGGGGAGGGFLSLTANGDIRVYGTIDAGGGRGGAGGWDPDGACNGANSGGGGGGAGGGIRLLCAGDIDLEGGTVTASGGAAGASGASSAPPTSGPMAGAGSNGRIVLEDGDSVITGMGTAVLVPGEGQEGFYRGVLDSTRFVKGSTESTVTTLPLAMGSILRPHLVTFPTLQAVDFVAGIPSVAAIPGEAAIVVELQGFLATPEGELDETTGSGWYTIGYFSDSGTPSAPSWNADAAPTDFAPDAGVGIANLDGRAVFVQVRVTFRLPPTMSPEDPGPYVERLAIRFSTDS